MSKAENRMSIIKKERARIPLILQFIYSTAVIRIRLDYRAVLEGKSHNCCTLVKE